MSNLDSILTVIGNSQLVSDDVLMELRKKLEQSSSPPDLRAAVRWLVQKEHVTSDQGRRLIASHSASAAGSAPPPGPAAAAAEEEEELELFPLDNPPPAAPRAQAPAPEADEVDEDLELFPIDEPQAAPPAGKPTASTAPPARPVAGGGASRWAGSPPRAAPASPAPPAARPAAPKPRKAAPKSRNAAPAQNAFDEQSLMQADAWGAGEDGFGQADAKQKGRRRGGKGWDTPLILIGGGGLLAMVLLGGLLYWRLSRGNAEQAFTLAEQDYTSGSYTQAVQKFDAFLENFP
ncbi:MAG TPA: hypothetical protein VHC19_22270, partial [Pirellulales bacterium]|nr:hypothetical protein [Pirellulales bacterium]